MITFGRSPGATEEGGLRRRRAVASLLTFANELERTRRISKASKGFLKELIVHENERVMSVGDALALTTASHRTAEEEDHALTILEGLIKQRASKSHEELFEICPLEEAHLLSQEDMDALAEGSDTKSLVYGEIDFWSFYDVIRAAVEGMETDTVTEDCGPSTEIGRNRNNAVSLCDAPGALHDQHMAVAQTSCSGQNESIGTDGKSNSDDIMSGSERCESGTTRQVRNERDKAPETQHQIHVETDVGVWPGYRESGNCDAWKMAHSRMVAAEEKNYSTKEVGRAPVRCGGLARKGLKFYDLGSGSGKAIFAAVLAVDFRCAIGIEVLTGVHEASTRILRRYRRLVEPVLSSPALVKLYHGSFLAPEFDWSDGDVIFANSTCFAEDTLLAIAEKATALRPGARVVTFTAALRTPWLRVLLKRRYMMSWGPATVFIHQKLSEEEYVKRIEETTPYDEDQGLARPGGDDQGTSATQKVSSSIIPLSHDGLAYEAVVNTARGKQACGLGDGGLGDFDVCINDRRGNVWYTNEEGDEVNPSFSAPQRPMHC